MRRGRWKFKPSPSYGKPDPRMSKAKASAEFVQSIFDVAPEYIRKVAREDRDGSGHQHMFEWFYAHSCDPRPPNNRLKPTPDYQLPPFPWDPDRPLTLHDIFG